MNKKWKIIFIISIILNLLIIYVGYKALEYRNHINEFLYKYTYVIDEFSGRKDYLDSNQTYLSDSTVFNRVIFIGAQITTNWDLSSSFPQIEALNRGIVGQRYAGYLLRFRSDVIALAPHAVVIEFSSYNFRPESKIEEFIEYTQSLVELSKANNIEPILATVLPIGLDFDVELEIVYEISDSIQVYNSWLRHYCEETKIEYVDFYTLLSDSLGNFDNQYLFNQIQPNQSGYSILSRSIKESLQKIGLSLAD